MSENMSGRQAGDPSKTSYSRKKIIAAVLFAGLLLVMLFGIMGPLVLRRIGVLPAETANVSVDEPDEYIDPVNIAAAYPFQTEDDGSQSLAASGNMISSLYGRVTSLNTYLSSLIDTIETYCDEHVPGRQVLIEIYIKIQNLFGSKVIDGDDVVVKMDNGLLTFLTDPLNEEDMKTCEENLTDFALFAEEQGADFLYVQTPCKINKYDNELPAGVDDGANENADRLTAALENEGLDVLDLRDEIVKDMDFDSAFYVTDHHWKPQTGLWAAGEILERLDSDCDGGFDLSYVDPGNYSDEVIPDLFLGALGKKTGMSYVGRDDFDVLTPDYDTDFTMTIAASGAVYKGDFSRALINEKELEVGDYFKKNPYASYFRDDQALVHVTNEELGGEGKKVLLLKDSFGLSVAPFLATAIGQMDVIDLRHFNGSLRTYVEETKPDIIVVMYNPKAISAPAGYHADLFDFR